MPLTEGNPLPQPPAKKDSDSAQANLFEQLGTTSPTNKNKAFVIALPVSGAEGTVDPLPDIAEIT